MQDLYIDHEAQRSPCAIQVMMGNDTVVEHLGIMLVMEMQDNEYSWSFLLYASSWLMQGWILILNAMIIQGIYKLDHEVTSCFSIIA